MDSMDRRTFLKGTVAATASASLTGCRGLLPSPEPTPEPTTEQSPTETPTVTATPQADVDRPVLLNAPEKVAAIRAKVEAGEQPWKRAFDEMRADAAVALDASPRSVTDNGAPAGEDNPNKYGSDAPYQEKDGVYSEDINRADYQAGLDMKDWIRDAALAYRFTGEDRFARKAIDLLHVWFVDEETRMYPSVINYGPHTDGLKGQNSIEHYIIIPAMVYGAALVDDHPYWEEKSGGSDPIRSWLSQFQKTLASGAHGGVESDEIHKWWVTTRLLVAGYLDDMRSFEQACQDWRTTVLQDFVERGTFENERPRTRGLFYSLSAMNALTIGAEIARHHDVDLYSFTKSGMQQSVIEKSHRYHAKFMLDPDEWPWKERKGLGDGERMYGTVSYELTYSRQQVDSYWEVIKSTGRPVYDRRILGYVTLTHGDLFELDF